MENKVSKINDFIDMFNLVSKISFTKRRGLLMLKLQCESVASHMYKVTLIATYINEKYNLKLDINKFILMSLIHDIAESYTGDIVPEDKISKYIKHNNEIQIISKLFNVSDNKLLLKMYDYYLEYLKQESKESKFVKFIDKIDFLYEIIRCKQQNNQNLTKFKKIELVYENLVNDIKLYNWGVNYHIYMQILEFICLNQKRCKTILSLVKFKIN